jgi:transcriptional regulator GlxA family with amidase domain
MPLGKLVQFKTGARGIVHTGRMKRAELLQSGAALAAICAGVPSQAQASPASRTRISRLTAPATGVPVAFLLSDGAVLIDFAGPWEVFQDANVPGRMQPAFIPYTVAETAQPITASDGMKIVPQYDLKSAPPPKLVVVPAQSPPSPATITWLKTVADSADVMMSVCTGAFVLAKAGLLDGHRATTHHSSLVRLAMEYPGVTVRRGARFVDDGRIATSAGLSAGIDLALHIVARYFGDDSAHQTAYDMEYQSQSWRDENSNVAYKNPPQPRTGFANCAVCWMEIDPKTSPSSLYRGSHYYFCMPAHKALFDASPQRFLNVS